MKKMFSRISVLLIVVMLFSLLGGLAIAEEPVKESEISREQFLELPSIVDEEEALQNGYIGRMYAEEKDLYSFVFQNEDGTNTLRVYSHPVKYVDSAGRVRDISLKIQEKQDGSFRTANHEIITTFQKELSDGIFLEHEDVKIKMTPENAVSAALASCSEDEQRISYTVDSQTSYEYALTYTGFKEDIVVSSYTGQTEYSFTLETNGLALREEAGNCFLVDREGRIRANIGDIIVFTADERNNTLGTMSVKTITAREKYLLTIHLEDSYLKDEKTKYPIRIDPTIEINYDNNGSGAIEDVTINSNGSSAGTSGSLYIGKRNSSGIARVLMRFPSLSLSNVASAGNISSASVELRDLMCETETMTISCYVFTGNTWKESTASWSTVNPNSYSALLSSNTISYANGTKQSTSHRYSFNILDAVKGWKNGTYSQEKGILFKASASVENGSGEQYKTFASYNRASYRPSLSVTYTPKMTLSVDCNHMAVGQTKQVVCVTSPSGITVSWTSSKPSVATVNSSGLVTGISEGNVSITASYYDASNGVTHSEAISLLVRDSLGIQDGEKYYIMNYHSNRFLSLEEVSDGNFTNVWTRPRSEMAISQWKPEKQSNGKFHLVSVYSSTGKCLDVTGTNIDLYANSSAPSLMFNIYRANASGDRQGLYLIRYGDYYVSQDSSCNVYLSKSLTDASYWSFMSVDKSNANYYSIIDPDSRGNVNGYRDTMERLGYQVHHWHCCDAKTAQQCMRITNSIFTFVGHGDEVLKDAGKATILFQNTSGEFNGCITANSAISNGREDYAVDSFPKNSLAIEKCVLYIGCSTGDTYRIGGKNYNLVDSTFAKGAHFVLGTTHQIFLDDIDAFFAVFFEWCQKGGNIWEAIAATRDDPSCFDTYYQGDRWQYLWY